MDLQKISYHGHFNFEYDQKAPDNNTLPPLTLNISNNEPAMLKFFIEPMIDIGGTLQVELAISPSTVSIEKNHVQLLYIDRSIKNLKVGLIMSIQCKYKK